VMLEAWNLKAGPPSVKEGKIYEINILAEEKRQGNTQKYAYRQVMSTV
jgi:hypothetical protein